MTKRLQIYKCEVCGNIVEMLHEGVGELVCCGKIMRLFEENTVDAAHEKHVPVFERSGEQVAVKVGEVPHPMEDKHYIEWIEVKAGDKAYREFLRPGQTPAATFCLQGDSFTVREYCNLHGLWVNED